MLEQAEWRGMPYYDAFWRKRHLTLREMQAIYANIYTYVFWALVAGILVLLDLHRFAEKVSLSALVSYTVSLIAVTVGIYLLVTSLGYRYARHHRRFFIFYPLVGLVAATIGTYIVELGMSATYGHGMSVEHALDKLPANIMLTLVMETLYITFVLPVAANAVGTPVNSAVKSTPVARQECTTLTLAGKTFYCKRLMSVSSHDHYVKIKTRDGEDMLRGRLADMIGQLKCRDGTQPHRSHWVARDSAVEMVAHGGHKYLKLVDGAEVPVARGRVADVRAWLEK